MHVRIQRIDTDLPLPIYETSGSVGFDFITRIETTVPPKEVVSIPGNVILAVPEGYMLMVASRSSTPKKKGLLAPHGIGIIDQDYCGSEDEIKVQVYNFRDESVTIHRGEKIGQGVFVRIDRFEFLEVERMDGTSRGGFGSTGGYQSGT